MDQQGSDSFHVWRVVGKIALGILLVWGVLRLLSIPPEPNYYKLAAEALDHGEYGEAERFYKLALKRAERDNEQYHKGVVHKGLGKVFMEQKLYLAAEEEFQLAAIEYAKASSADSELQECYHVLGELQLTNNNCSDAVATFEKSLIHFRESHMGSISLDHQKKLFKMAKEYHDAGNRCKNTKFYKKALWYLRECDADPGGRYGRSVESDELQREKDAIIHDAGLSEQAIEAELFQLHRNID
jgi:tetratricopeptide (TPR) repeat protein